MNNFRFRLKNLLFLPTLLLLAACAVTGPSEQASTRQTIYQISSAETDILGKHAPVFLVEDSDRDYNKIGIPAFKEDSPGDFEAYINTEHPSYFALRQDFKIGKKQYTNLIYRVHFPETPLPHLTSGKNVGILVYITLNENEEPLLITTLHTCGCYLAIIPTDKFNPDGVPKRWSFAEVKVYGETLPGLLKTGGGLKSGDRLILTIGSETHRVKDIRFARPALTPELTVMESNLKPMADLASIPAGSKHLSFFESEGIRQGYVRGSHKPLELLFMSWWTMDPFIGVDKALGPEEETGSVFYTSLKFLDRRKSNIWNFPGFLEYWGWKLK